MAIIGRLPPASGGAEANVPLAVVCDVLHVLERNHGLKLVGGDLVMLQVVCGGVAPSSVDEFETWRKSWDEAMRRARARKRLDGPGLAGFPPVQFIDHLMSVQELLAEPRRRTISDLDRRELQGLLLAKLQVVALWSRQLTTRDLRWAIRAAGKFERELLARTAPRRRK